MIELHRSSPRIFERVQSQNYRGIGMKNVCVVSLPEYFLAAKYPHRVSKEIALRFPVSRLP